MARQRPLRDAGLAVSLLTLVPTPARWPEGERTGVAGWFPAVGLALGAAAWGAAHAIEALGWRGNAALVVAALIVAGWAGLTRMLHWDGLADVADGLWGGHTPERRLEIMSDSSTGAFGATAVVLVALVQTGAIASVLLGGHQMPLLVVPALARLSASCAAWLGKPAREGGLGRSVMARPTLLEIVLAGVVAGACIGALFAGYGVAGAALGASGVVLALVVPHLLSEPVGGVTGDIMGASVLVCEATLFASAAILWGA